MCLAAARVDAERGEKTRDGTRVREHGGHHTQCAGALGLVGRGTTPRHEAYSGGQRSLAPSAAVLGCRDPGVGWDVCSAIRVRVHSRPGQAWEEEKRFQTHGLAFGREARRTAVRQDCISVRMKLRTHSRALMGERSLPRRSSAAPLGRRRLRVSCRCVHRYVYTHHRKHAGNVFEMLTVWWCRARLLHAFWSPTLHFEADCVVTPCLDVR